MEGRPGGSSTTTSATLDSSWTWREVAGTWHCHVPLCSTRSSLRMNSEQSPSSGFCSYSNLSAIGKMILLLCNQTQALWRSATTHGMRRSYPAGRSNRGHGWSTKYCWEDDCADGTETNANVSVEQDAGRKVRMILRWWAEKRRGRKSEDEEPERAWEKKEEEKKK